MKRPELPTSIENEEHPSELLFSYFQGLFAANRYRTGKTQRTDSLHGTALRVRSRYSGLSHSEKVDRQIFLELYATEKSRLLGLPYGVVTAKPIGTGWHTYLEYCETPERRVIGARLAAFLKQIRDVGGIEGIETFSVYALSQPEVLSSRLPCRRPDVLLSHSYHLPNERLLYDLPQTTSGDRPTPLYPYLGPSESESTLVFWNGEPVGCANDYQILCKFLGSLPLETLS